jgi:wyosine [tRNA(Phe)-imidazoG37] synthetase (radical SAM superfamily)
VASFPILHGAFDTIRFGRVFFAEIAPEDPPGTPCRYCRLLTKGAAVPSRSRFSNPESSARAILDPLGSGEAPDRIVLGGAGDPLREVGLASVLRRVRAHAHLGAALLVDGSLLGDREVRRDAGEADMVVGWLPALQDTREPMRASETGARRDAFDRLVAGYAALRRETPAQVVIEIGVRPGENDGAESLDAWNRAIDAIRPHRVHVIPASLPAEVPIAATPAPSDEALPAALERVRAALGSRAGAALADPTPVDRRCYCTPAR